VKISLRRREDGFLEFSYSDNGPGLPNGFEPGVDGKMGYSLIMLLVKDQLRGFIDIDTGKAFRCLIRLNESVIHK
jgi:two-component sensor histidine kinase